MAKKISWVIFREKTTGKLFWGQLFERNQEKQEKKTIEKIFRRQFLERKRDDEFSTGNSWRKNDEKFFFWTIFRENMTKKNFWRSFF